MAHCDQTSFYVGTMIFSRLKHVSATERFSFNSVYRIFMTRFRSRYPTYLNPIPLFETMHLTTLSSTRYTIPLSLISKWKWYGKNEIILINTIYAFSKESLKGIHCICILNTQLFPLITVTTFANKMSWTPIPPQTFSICCFKKNLI